MKTAGGVGNALWLPGWYVDKNNFMELLLKEQENKIVLTQHLGGAVVKKKAYRIDIVPNVVYEVRIAFNGFQFDVSVDSVHVMSLVPIGAVATGTVGFQAKDTVGAFGSIRVQ